MSPRGEQIHRFVLSGHTSYDLSVDMFLNDCSKIALLVETVSELSHMSKPSPRLIDLVNMHVETYI